MKHVKNKYFKVVSPLKQLGGENRIELALKKKHNLKPKVVKHETGQVDFSVCVGKIDQPVTTSISIDHTAEGRKAWDLRNNNEFNKKEGMLVLSFSVAKGADQFKLGEFASTVKDMVELSSSKSFAGMEVTYDNGREDNLFHLAFGTPKKGKIAFHLLPKFDALQLHDGPVAKISTSHCFGGGQDQGPLQAKIEFKSTVAQPYLKSLGKVMEDNSIKVTSDSSSLKAEVLFDSFDDMQKAMPVQLGGLDLSSLDVITQEVNFVLAAILQNPNAPQPVKDTIKNGLSLFDSLKHAKLCVGKHIFSFDCEGIDIKKFFLPLDQLTRMNTSAGLPGGILTKLQLPIPIFKKGSKKNSDSDSDSDSNSDSDSDSYDETVWAIKTPCLGLSGAGKTTFVKRAKDPENTALPGAEKTVTPAEKTYHKNGTVLYELWDNAGSADHSSWHCHSISAKALIWVVDSAARDQFNEAKEALAKIYNTIKPWKGSLPVLVFANKQDVTGAASTAEITDALGLDALKTKFLVVGTSFITGASGIQEGLDWMNQNKLS